MKNPILQASIEEISHDTKFIRLAIITTFVHSVIFLLYMAYWASSVLAEAQGGDNAFLDALVSVSGAITGINIRVLILVSIPLLIGYSILPPIGEGAMIYYLNNPRKQGTASLGKGLTKFLQMFEFDAAITFFNIVLFLVAVSRIYIMGIGWNTLVIIAMMIWLIVILLAEFLLPYTRFFIALENMKFFEAMRASMQTSIQHFNITFKYIMVDVILHLRFIINIILVFGIPLGLMYLGSWIGITDNGLVQGVFILLIIILFLITAYINGIIEAFFTTYRYKVYKYIKQEEAEDEAAIEQGELGNELATVKEEEKQAQVPQQVIINQYIVQPGAHPPQTGNPPGQTVSTGPNGEQIIHPTSEVTIPQTPTDHQQIPLPPEAEQYIANKDMENYE